MVSNNGYKNIKMLPIYFIYGMIQAFTSTCPRKFITQTCSDSKLIFDILQRNWVLGADNCYHFNAAEETCAAAAGVLPSAELAEQTIEYARHLEMIV